MRHQIDFDLVTCVIGNVVSDTFLVILLFVLFGILSHNYIWSPFWFSFWISTFVAKALQLHWMCYIKMSQQDRLSSMCYLKCWVKKKC